MPPVGDNAPVQKSGVLRGVLWLIPGILLGALLILVAEYFAMQHPTFQNWLRNYFVSLSVTQFGDVTPQVTPPSLQSLQTASTTIAVPRAYATADYYTALNNLYFDYMNMITVGSQIGPLFLKLNSETAGGNYGGVIDLAIQIKTLIAQEKQITNDFGQHLVALSVANQESKDAVTKSLTQDLISAGNAFRAGLPPYFEALDGIFSSPTPSSDEVARVTALTQKTIEDLNTFKVKLQLVLDHFKAAARTN